MKSYFEDYKDLCIHSKQFYKDHWLGTLIITAVGTTLSFAPVIIPVIKEKIEDRKSKKIKRQDSNEEIES